VLKEWNLCYRLHFMRINAGILPLTLAMSLVISGICSAIIIAAYYFRLVGLKYDLDVKLHDNATSGIAYLLAQSESLDDNIHHYLDLFGDGEDSVVVVKKRWGVFNLLVSKAFQGNEMAYKASLAGHRPTGIGICALYLSDERRPLSIAGDVILNGDCYLPKSGIRTTYINRMGYSKKELVHGKQMESIEGMPEINQELLKICQRLSQQDFHQDYLLFPYNGLSDTINNSFYNSETLYLYSDGTTVIDRYIKGNVIIHASGKIIVMAGAKLEDVVLIAPYIEIQDDFRGQAQFFARDSIKVQDRCKLLYPSALVIYNDQGKITLGENSEIKGLVFLAGDEKNYDDRILRISENSVVTGQVYIDGFVEHKGEIHGNLTCRKFMLKMDHSSYENHLFNGIIDAEKLPEYFLGTDLYEFSEGKKIVKWVK
jgi:hypothetical protein